MSRDPSGSAAGDGDGAHEGDAARESAEEILRRLAQGRRGFERFRVLDQVDQGGMGVVLRVEDPELKRTLAVKRIRADRAPAGPSQATPEQARQIARFVDEALVAAQLDHPGIVPVHELGLDPQGMPYFTMKLVRGENLREVIARVHRQQDGWSLVRALGVLLRVCEAVTYAHEHGVVHRDLKPANVMVGRHGEVYVMDWGLARVAWAVEYGTGTHISSNREVVRESAGSSPLDTGRREVFGSPPYMAPEQAQESHTVTPQADVYSAGAILYHLLTGAPPYLAGHPGLDNDAVWKLVKQGPPAPIEARAPKAPPELVSICRRAMERDPARRYARMQDLTDDLRAFLENRVVRAHRTGPLVELRKWTVRNRGTAAALVALVLVVATAGFAWARVEARRTAEALRELEERGTLEMLARTASLPRLGPASLSLWDAWVADATAAVERLPLYEREIADIEDEQPLGQRIEDPLLVERRPDGAALGWLETKLEVFSKVRDELEALPAGPARPADAEHDLEVLRLELSELPDAIAAQRRKLADWRTWRWRDAGLESRYARLRELRAGLREISEARTGLLARVRRDIWAARAAVSDHRELWAAACAEIADVARSPMYQGLKLGPQLGLVPLGRDERSGLHEFWHVPSGARPARGEDGRWSIRPETGIVLVLVPGGVLSMGAQQDHPDRPNYVPPESLASGGLGGNERWHERVTLAPYFLARHELTQAQWVRLAGRNPSETFAGGSHAWPLSDGRPKRPIPRWSRTHPVENLSWNEARAALAAWSLELPTEAQWEWAARGGTGTPFWWGTAPGAGRALVSALDPATRQVRELKHVRDVALLDEPDHFPFHAPVDAFPPNPWGFESISGNVREWCRDWFADVCEKGGFQAGSGEHVPKYAQGKAVRGGSYLSELHELRVSSRYGWSPDLRAGDRGVRPARSIETTPALPKEDPR